MIRPPRIIPEIRQDHGLRPPVESSESSARIPQAGQGERSPLLVGPGESRYPADRTQNRVEPVAVLRPPPRQRLSLGGAEEARNAPKDRGGAVGGDSGD